MGIFDRLRGTRQNEPTWGRAPVEPEQSADEQAIARYRYMLKTAPPETIEQAHAEAFAKLTPEQRRMLLEQLSAQMPEAERAAAARAGASPGSLAQAATRAEMRQPGTLERTLGGAGGGGIGFGGMLAGSLLGSVAGTVLGSMIGQHFFASHPNALDGSHAASGDQASGQDEMGAADDSIHASDHSGGDFDMGGDTFDV